MQTNIEIKAKIQDYEKIFKLAEQISDVPVQVIEQKDTYYKIERGRLKLRIINDIDGELIFYRRDNVFGPKKSLYIIHTTDNPESLDLILSSSLGKISTIEKKRHLYLSGQTRIHIDDVRGLGFFVELEVVLTDRQTEFEGIRIADHLIKQLDITKEQLVESSYIELMNEKINETQKIQD